MKWKIEPFSSSVHQRDSFTCGQPALDAYVRHYASQDLKRRVALVFVACVPGETIIQGYYSLSAASFRKNDLPAEAAKKLPHYPIPAAILGRLAISSSCQGQGMGKYLLMDCFYRVLQASKWIAVNAVIADAKDEKAKQFYEKYGFQAFASEPLKLFIPLTTIESLLKTSAIS